MISRVESKKHVSITGYKLIKKINFSKSCICFNIINRKLSKFILVDKINFYKY